jgi:hypothetical protein
VSGRSGDQPVGFMLGALIGAPLAAATSLAFRSSPCRDHARRADGFTFASRVTKKAPRLHTGRRCARVPSPSTGPPSAG